jgi:hypothetical protein
MKVGKSLTITFLANQSLPCAYQGKYQIERLFHPESTMSGIYNIAL